ncbi:phage adaptor protein [Comamonas sp. MYb396]|uniref:phage adaptor protein n=1 Tax=Comamonas sp. MYb396 TaxID=2745302 RepID=UPI0030B59C28
MTLQELIASYRAQSLDNFEPYLADDKLLGHFASEAQVEACRRGQLLVSTVTIPVAVGAQEIELPATAIRVIRSSIGGSPLQEITADGMDEYFPGWQDDAHQGKPRYLVSGVNTGRLCIWPVPAEAFTIRLTLQNLPSKRLVNCNDAPEIRPETHPALVDWMLHRVYSRTDGDLIDPAKAAASLARFEAEFGRKASGRNEQWVRQGDGLMPGPIA